MPRGPDQVAGGAAVVIVISHSCLLSGIRARGGSYHGAGGRTIATTPPRGTAPPRAIDSRITPTLRLGRAARTCQDRPPHPGECHGQKERQEGAERKEVPEGAVGAGRPGRSSDNRRSVRESATEEELVGRLGHASGTHDGSRAAQAEGKHGLASTRSAAAVWLVRDPPGSRHRLTRRSWNIRGSGRATGPPVDAARTSHDR